MQIIPPPSTARRSGPRLEGPHLESPRRPEPRVTVLRTISAPIDGGRLIPRPPPSLWSRIVLVGLVLALAAGGLAFAFLRATALS